MSDNLIEVPFYPFDNADQTGNNTSTYKIFNHFTRPMTAVSSVGFEKEYLQYMDFLKFRCGSHGDRDSLTSMRSAMIYLLGMYNRVNVIEILDFWVGHSGSDFEEFVNKSVVEMTYKLGLEKEHGFVPLSTTRFLVRQRDQIVGLLAFGQSTSEKYIMAIGEPWLSDKVFNFWKERVDLNLPSTVIRLDGSNPTLIKRQVKRIKNKRPVNNPKTFFPHVDKTPAQMLTEFESSDANVLFLYGEAGLGKTQFIREMISIKNKSGGKVYMADTVEVFQHPALVPFIHDLKDGSWFVTEDSTEMVAKRTEGNSLMAGILNASEGISSGNVKFIISANITSLKDVDSALIRPGRTFAAYQFKSFTPEQGNAARLAVDLEPIDFGDTKVLTLAEALNWKEYQALKAQQTKVGF